MTNFRFDTAKEMQKAREFVAKPARAAKEDDPARNFSNSSRSAQPNIDHDDLVDLQRSGIDDVLSEYLRVGSIRIDSDWAGTVWMVATRQHATGREDGVVYHADEIRILMDLSPSERILVHGFKKRFGGWLEKKDGEER